MTAGRSRESSLWDDFILFSDRVERYIRYCLLTLAILLVICQLLLHHPGLRPYLTVVDRLEGVQAERR